MSGTPGQGWYQATDGNWYPMQLPPQPEPKKSSSVGVGCVAFLLVGIVGVILFAAFAGRSSSTAAPPVSLSGTALDNAVAAAVPPDVDAIVKNPESVRGRVFVMFVQVSQLDAATGKCQFRARWDAEGHDFGIDYKGDNALFSAGEPCPALDGIDNDDRVKVWVRGAGPVTYDAQVGGTRVVPSFTVLKAELVEKR